MANILLQREKVLQQQLTGAKAAILSEKLKLAEQHVKANDEQPPHDSK
jgi:hypothetical protein